MKSRRSQSNGEAGPSSAEVSTVIAAIAESGVLGKSERRERLLRYLVDKEMAGQGEQLKAFAIAMDVLGRDASFEASTDSIVRSEVGRLRDSLKLYFAERGHQESIRIDIPKGTYRPKITTSQVQTTVTRRFPIASLVALVAVVSVVLFWAVSGRQDMPVTTPVSISDLPYEVIRISVVPFEGLGENPEIDALAFGMYSELVMDLSVYPWISVVSSLVDARASYAEHADYVLTGNTFWDDATLTTHAELVALPGRDVIWSGNMTVPVTHETVTQSIVEVSTQIATVLGSIHGVAHQLAKSRTAQVSSDGLDALLCFLGLYRYLQYPTDAAHLTLRDCLSDTVAEFPKYGDAWAALAIIQMDQSRFERNPRPGTDPWKEAAASIEQALIYAPTRMPSLNAAIIHAIEGPKKNPEDFERNAELLLSLYPRHPPTLFNVGSRMAEFMGEWDKGLELVTQALELEPNPPSFFHLTQAYNQALLGSDKDAWLAAQKLTTQTSKSELLLRFLAASRNGFVDDQEHALRLLSGEGLTDKADLVAHVRGRGYTDELEAALLDQLDTAFQDGLAGD